MSESTEKEPSLSEPPELSDADLAAFAELVKQDPETARVFEAMRGRGLKVLRGMMREVESKLMELEPARNPEAQSLMDIRRLLGAGRDRESIAKLRRELAQHIVLGALVNIDNPDWDPLDPSTSRRAEDSAILSLLTGAKRPGEKGRG